MVTVVRRTPRRSARRPVRPGVLIGLLLALLASLLSNGLVAATPAAAATCPCSIWSSTTTPGTAADSDRSAVEVGVKFRSDVAGQITGIRFYKGSTNTGTHVGHLWTSTGTKLGTVTFSGETTTGWQQATFSSPITINANTTYVASYYAPSGHYAVDGGFFASKGVDNGYLHALQDGVDGANGIYRYGSGGGFPTNTYQSSNYWVDVAFTTTATDTTPPTVTSQSPASGATNVPTTTTVSATFSESVQSSTVSMNLTGPTGTTVSGSTSYNSSTQTATFTPSAALAVSTTYTAKVSGAADTSGNVMTPVTWTFTTSSSTSGCPCTIWPSTTTPTTVDSNDASAVELGVKFTSSTAGYITGIRFYKSAGNTGTHTGSLWSASGTRLSTATFSGETGSGWQTVSLPAPVAVTANTTYVASYHTTTGHYSVTNNGFSSAVTRGPLTALSDASSGGNGVYLYGGSAFPTNTFQASNYWVDVVFDTTAADTTPPTVSARTPAPNATGVPTSSTVTATFSEPVQASTVSMTLSGPSGNVPGAVSYDSATSTATFTPSAALAASTTYTASVSGAKDTAGNTMTSVNWSFTTAAPPPPALDQGPGGPVLVIKSSVSGASGFTGFTAEILRAEGINEFATADLSTVDATTLNKYDVVLLGATPLTSTQVSMFTAWVQAGGNLIAFRPDKQLASLLGLTSSTGSLANAYLQVDVTQSPGAGITDQTVQFHGAADQYTLAGARAVATLYSTASAATSNPAVSLNSVGTSGGQAAAFTYDLPQSVVYSRQGNPAWAGTERDTISPIRSDDLYFGGSSPNWVDLNKVAIPQADEQQRLLANMIETMNLDHKPLPRFWYFPNSAKAVVVATGDDHGNGGTAGRFNTFSANSPAGCVVAQWQCLRFTSFVYPNEPLTDSQAAAYNAQGFEIGLHPQNGCGNFTPTNLDSDYSSQLSTWAQVFPSLPSPVSNRYHCLVWSDWFSQPTTELRYGIRLDTNYYYWPGSWANDRPGFMTGSGMPMRFANTDGSMIDVYQAATQMQDEGDGGQTYPFEPNTLLDDALGPLGYYGAFTANMHTDNAQTFDDDQLLASATSRGVPMISARQLLTWLDGRNNSSFSGIGWSGNQLSFTVAVGTGATGLTAMVPTVSNGGQTLTSLTLAGSPVSFTRTTIKGLEYAMFQAAAGTYTASYGSAAAAAVQTTSALATSSTAVTLTANTAPADTTVVSYGTSAKALTQRSVNAEQGAKHRHDLKGLAASTTYYYQVTATGPSGATTTSPVGSFKTPANPKTAPNVSGYSYYVLPDGTAAVSWTTDRITDATVFLGTSPQSVNMAYQSSVSGTAHVIVATGLKPGTTYYARVQSTDADGNKKLWPAASSAPASFVTSAAGVADHTAPSFRSGTEGPGVVVSDDGLGGVTLANGLSKGQFTSRVLDSQQMVTWDRLVYFADQPSGSQLQVSVRTGSMPTPDGTWTAWTPVSQGGRVDASSRYVQYQVNLVAGSKGAPVLRAVGITHNGQLPVSPGEQ